MVEVNLPVSLTSHFLHPNWPGHCGRDPDILHTREDEERQVEPEGSPLVCCLTSKEKKKAKGEPSTHDLIRDGATN